MTFDKDAHEASTHVRCPTEWRKSRQSGASGSCLEAAPASGLVAVRDSKDPQGPALTFAPHTWSRFVVSVKDDGLARGT